MATVSVSQNMSDLIIHIGMERFDTDNPASLISKALEEAASKFASEWVEQNKALIIENINPIAVANLAIADSAKLVRTQYIDPEESKK
jgi:hypothetical protein